MPPEEQVVTGEAVALDLQLAGAGSRGIAALIDFAAAAALQLVLLVVVVTIDFSNDAALLTVIIIIEVAVLLGYPVMFETLWRGQTLGKAAMGLRVVRDDGGPIRFRHALVRGLVGVTVDKPGITYGLGALIPMIVSTRKKRFGDFAAGTIVLQDRVPGRVSVPPIAMPPQLAGWAADQDLSRVDDDLALRLRHFVGRATQLTPQARDSLEHQLVTEVVARVGPPPAGTPGWAIISAIVAERRRRAQVASQAPAPTWSAPASLPAAEIPPAPSSTTGFLPPG